MVDVVPLYVFGMVDFLQQQASGIKSTVRYPGLVEDVAPGTRCAMVQIKEHATSRRCKKTGLPAARLPLTWTAPAAGQLTAAASSIGNSAVGSRCLSGQQAEQAWDQYIGICNDVEVSTVLDLRLRVAEAPKQSGERKQQAQCAAIA